jgi:gephyrin
MSRLVAGVRHKTIIITVPGSPKGARENLEAIIKLLPHACMQAAGMDSRALHAGGVKKLEKDAGVSSPRPDHSRGHSHGHHHDHSHSHSHSHGGGHHTVPRAHTAPSERPPQPQQQSNDPSAGPSSRYRESPYPMLTVQKAIEEILEKTPSLGTITRHVDTSLVGYTLAEDVTASEPVPAFRASIVDGYAIVAGASAPSTKGTWPVVAVSHAEGSKEHGEGLVSRQLEHEQLARITTGAPLPPGATSVVMVEDTVVRARTEDGKEEKEVEVLTSEIVDGENVREVGSDIAKGEVILKAGERITSVGGELGLLASVGRAEVRVWQKPIVGVLSTGDEIVPHDREGALRLGEVRDVNRLTVMSAIQGWGYEVRDLGIARDS